MNSIAYPYIPEGRTIEYVPADNPYMQEAKVYAREHSLDKSMPNASLVVKDGLVIGRAANGSNYHDLNDCERVRLNIPTGQGYELCEGCSPKNHSESKAIANAQSQGADTRDADLYLWGHWWCCEPCWNSMSAAGIARVILLEGSEILFNKNSPNNIIGKQFA
jgi:deoxycytidylate deaminase